MVGRAEGRRWARWPSAGSLYTACRGKMDGDQQPGSGIIDACENLGRITSAQAGAVIWVHRGMSHLILSDKPLTNFPPAVRGLGAQIAWTTHRAPAAASLSPPAMFPSIPLFAAVSAPFKRSQLGLFQGKMKQYGNSVPNSKHKTRRSWLPNVHNQRLFSDTLGRFIKIKVAARALKTIKKVRQYLGGVGWVPNAGVGHAARKHRQVLAGHEAGPAWVGGHAVASADQGEARGRN